MTISRPPIVAERMKAMPLSVSSVPLSEDWLACDFIEQNQDTLRYTAEWNKYYRSTRTEGGGCFWKRDTILATFDQIRARAREHAATILNSPARQAKLCSAATVAAVERLCRSDQRTAMPLEGWDRDEMLLNTPAGLCDLTTGKMYPGNPQAYCTKVTAIAPSKEKPEEWLRCLKDWTGGDEAYEHLLQQWSGYCATGSTREQKFCFAHGAGANGKSTYINALAGILKTYCQVVPPEVFSIPRGGGTSHPTGLASLVSCRLGFANETEANSTWALSQVKGLVAGDPILARYMRQDYFQFTPCAKLFVVGNHRPLLSSVDEAVKRRLILLPFEVTIPPEKRDQKLSQKLRVEWGGILQWMITGAVDWYRNGLQLPDCVKVATAEYVDSQDLYGHWIADRCVTGPNHRAKAASLYSSWLDFCTVNNIYKTSQRVFLSSLVERPDIKRKHTEDGNFYEGIGLNHHKNGYEL